MEYGPGKFESCGNYSHIAQWLYNNSDGGFGSVDELGWYDKLDGEKIKGHGPFFAIISEDSQGFVDLTWFDSKVELDAAWDEIEESYTEVTDDDERSNGPKRY